MTPESADIQPVGTGLSRDISNGEAVEADLSRLIERRSRQRDADEQEELWRESVRRYNDRKQEQLRNEWCEYHQGQAARLRAVFEPLVAHHEERAAKFMDVRPKGVG
jgi:hypothetical protein